MSSGAQHRYWAFISYSHRDEHWAQWLHRQLETYRVPQRLRARGAEPLPRRLFPVFRDVEELPSSPDLSAVIDRALLQSRHLIVIASPHSAASRWVDQEICRFRELGRGDRILCLIVDGEPHASERPGSGLLECFPPAVLNAEREVIAADVRTGRDSKAKAKLKLIAGLLGVELDVLRRRERQRQFAQRLLWAAAACVVLGLALLGWRAAEHALRAQALRARIETLYEKGRQDLLAKNQMRAAVYLNEAYKLGEDTPALRYMLARAMQLVDSEEYAMQSGRPIIYVESSPDARRFLTVDDDWTIDLWDAADGHRLGQSRMPRFTSRWFQPSFDYSSRTLSYQGTEQDTGQSRYFVVDASNGRVLAALPTLRNMEFTIGSVDPAGRYAVYVAPDGAVHRYDLSRQRDERWLAGPKVLATYSRDGRRVISGTESGKLELWDAYSSVRGPVLEGLNARPTSIASNADGSLLAASAIDGKLRVWDLRCRCVQLTAGHAGLAYLRFDRAGTHLISNGVDGVQVWDTARQALLYAAQYANAQSGTLSRLSADGRRIARIAESRLAVRDTETGAEVFTLDGHLGPAASMFFSDDGVHMTSAGADGRAIVWRAPRMPLAEFRHPVNPRDLYRLGAYDPPVAAVFSRRGDRIASGGADGMVRIWAADGFELRQQWPADPSGVQVLAFSPDDTLLAVGGLGSLKLYDAASGSLARVLDERSPMVLRLRFSRDGRRLAVSTLGGIVRVWDVADGTRLFEGRRDGSRSQSLSADGQLLAFGHEGVVHLVRLADGRELWSRAIEEQPGTPSTEINAVEFSADGTRLAVGSYRNAVAVLDARDGRLLAEDHDPTSTNIAGVVFSHDGASVLVSDYNRQARVWRWQEGRLRRLDGHAEGLDAGSFSLDDALVYTWAKDGAVLAWDADSGLLLDRLGFHGSRVSPGDSAGELSPDGERLLSGSVDGVIRLWDIGRERRGPAAIERLLRCRSPWQLHATELQPVMPQDGACPRQSSPVRPTGGPALP